MKNYFFDFKYVLTTTHKVKQYHLTKRGLVTIMIGTFIASGLAIEFFDRVIDLLITI